MNKKLVAILSALLLVTTSVIGCSTKKEQPAQSDAVMKDGKYDPPVTFNITAALPEDIKFKNGETIEDNVHTKWAAEHFGINFKYMWVLKNTGSTIRDKQRLALSSNEQLPDIFMMGDQQLIADYIDSGRVMDITEAIEKYASPRLKEVFKNFPDALYPVTKDGKIYGIPRFSGGNISDQVMWIRQDWLDKLGLEQPKTLEDLEKVMDAFVNQDPDGNNKKDTIAVSIAGKDNFGTWMASSSFAFGAFGSTNMPGQWALKDGSLQYASIQPEIKKGLEKLREWYQKGYIDKEFMLHDAMKASEAFVQGRSGIMTCGIWMPDWPMPDLLKNVPDAKVVPIPTIKGPEGKVGRWGEGLYTGHFLFNKDFKYMEGYFKYLDALYSYQFGEGVFKDGLFEGYDYVKENGVPVYDRDKIPGGYVDPGRYFLTDHTPDIPYKQSEIEARLGKGDKPVTAFEKALSTNNPLRLKAATIVSDENQFKMISKFTGPPTKTMRTQSEFLKKLEDETFAKIVYGQLSLDEAFDKFVKDWQSNGGDTIAKEVNDWYKSVSKK
jgi:putative aldouronate transport system substrate-binding protein